MASEIRVNTINNRSGLGTITISDTGAVFAGVTTITNLQVTGTTTGIAATDIINTQSINVIGITTVSAGSTSTPSITPSGDSNTGIFFPSADTIAFGEGGVEALRIDSSGRVGIGNTSPSGKLHVGTSGSGIVFDSLTTASMPSTGNDSYIVRDNTDGGLNFSSRPGGGGLYKFFNGSALRMVLDDSGRLLVGTSSNSANSRAVFQGSATYPTAEANIFLSRGETAGNGVTLGNIKFSDTTGGIFAGIAGETDATPGTNDYPGRLVFLTQQDGGSGNPTERMRINAKGYLKVSTNGSYNSATGEQHEINDDYDGNDTLLIRSTSTTFVASSLSIRVNRAQTSAYRFFGATSSNTGDLEFNLRGDGNGYCDGSWNGGGADYAEYFEWSDSNSNAEDRRGISVVLDGDKIREAVTGEEPIGVISGNPSVVGDAAWNKWDGKYLRDDFGTYILDENGERQLNPAYDPDVEYINREDRPEWDCVGLMGKLRIRKGQITGSRWIKMRDISDSVEEWLVR